MTNKNVGKKNCIKGAQTEELLADYFRELGYFVARGVTFKYESYEVTDIDLWIYIRSSAISRQTSIVDIKNKRTPQAIERIFWTKGLQQALNANNAIVATTDSRPEVVEFGKKLDVTVLGGRFISKLKAASSINGNNRLSEDELIKIIKDNTLGKVDGDWMGRFQYSKSLLITNLNFNSINYWLIQARYFFEEAIAQFGSSDLGFRLFLKEISFFCIGLDYMLKEFSFDDKDHKYEALVHGFSYGNDGKKGLFDSVNKTTNILVGLGYLERTDLSKIENDIEKVVGNVDTDILGKYFSNVNVAKNLFKIAKEMDDLSAKVDAIYDTEVSIEAKAMIGCLLDFWDINRSNPIYSNLKTI